MMDTMSREILAARLFQERSAQALAYAPSRETAEMAGVRADMERARKRRERVARFLKALAMRIAPVVEPETRHTSPLATLT
jgi:hypothetical protein